MSESPVATNINDAESCRYLCKIIGSPAYALLTTSTCHCSSSYSTSEAAGVTSGITNCQGN